MTSNTQIELIRVEKEYAGANEKAVEGIDLSIREGEFMTFLGGSGAGKTTTLNMIAGFESITSGKILLNGEDISKLPPYKRNLGMVFQSYALFPHMSVFENIAFPLRQRNFTKDDITKRVNEVLELVHLAEFGSRAPAKLSGGQQQRVALARAIVFSPSVLLLDEPLGALDRRLREFLQTEIRRIHQELGITFIYVTHDQEEALGLSDRIAIFKDGRLEQVDTPENIYEAPQSKFVATFLGDSNVFEGDLTTSGLNTGWAQFATPHVDIPDDKEMSLVVRPERMRLSTQANGDANLVPGRVLDVVFQGPYRRVTVELSADTKIVVREANYQEINTSAVQPGDEIFVSWKAEDGVLVTNS